MEMPNIINKLAANNETVVDFWLKRRLCMVITRISFTFFRRPPLFSLSLNFRDNQRANRVGHRKTMTTVRLAAVSIREDKDRLIEPSVIRARAAGERCPCRPGKVRNCRPVRADGGTV
jgi:hypothetical protein